MIELPKPPRLSAIVAGVWRLAAWRMTVAERVDWIAACLALGVTSFDHADIYGGGLAETQFGEALAAAPDLKPRLEIVTKTGIALKGGGVRVKHYRQSRESIVAAAEQSLRRLGVEAIDLLLIHRPSPLMDAGEIARAFEDLRASGKVRAFGASNFTSSQFDLLDKHCPLATNQVECSPLHPDPMFDGCFDQALSLDRRPMVWSPLAGGRLFGDEPAALRVRAVLERIAIETSTTPETVAYAWLLRHPSRPIPISGSRRIDALERAVAALALRLGDQDWFEILEAGRGREVD